MWASARHFRSHVEGAQWPLFLVCERARTLRRINCTTRLMIIGCVLMVAAMLLVRPSHTRVYTPGAAIPVGRFVSSGDAARVTVHAVTIPSRLARVAELPYWKHTSAAILYDDRDFDVRDSLGKNDVNLQAAVAEGQFSGLRCAGAPAAITGTGVLPAIIIPHAALDRAGLRGDDTIVAAAGHAISTDRQLATTVRASAGTTVTMRLKRGAELRVPIPAAARRDPWAALGITPATAGVELEGGMGIDRTRLPFSSGSAGLAFALAVYQSRHPATHAPKFAATGAVSADGAVHEVGLVRLKAMTVQRAGLAYFLVPDTLAAEAREAAPGLTIVGVSSVEEAAKWLQHVGAATDAPVARCSETTSLPAGGAAQ